MVTTETEMTATPIVAYFSAENLMSDRGDFQLDVSLECKRGSMTCVIGASGSGKSTLLRLIAGLDKSTARAHGRTTRILLDGSDITDAKPARRGIGMVFQSHALFTHLRVDDNVGYGLRCAGISKKEARSRATEFLARFNLAGFGARSVETLSGGEAQRVSLARTLIVQPKLVLFDEPLSALDAPLRRRLAAEIRRLQTEIGFTGIMVTHDIAEARAVSDRIILLSHGRIGWHGAAANFDDALLEP